MPERERDKKVLEVLYGVYPNSLTTSQICMKTGIPSCSISPIMRSLISRRAVKLVGKKGRENCYHAIKKISSCLIPLSDLSMKS
jgi:DNA-binding transcriptional regulator GbsR (MarR family)